MVSTRDIAISLHIRSPDQLKLKVPPKFSFSGEGGYSRPIHSNSKCQDLPKFSFCSEGGGVYAVIVNHIEKHEASRVSDWKYIEDMVLETAIKVVVPRDTHAVTCTQRFDKLRE